MKNFYFILFLFFTPHLFGQTITIDLSKNLNTTFTQTISPQIIKSIQLVNKSQATGVNYTVNFVVHHQQVTPLSIPGAAAAAPGAVPVAAPAAVPSACTQLDNDNQKLSNDQTEANIPNDITEIKNDLTTANAVACKDYINTANGLISKTVEIYSLSPSITVNKGDELIITIQKDSKNIWTYDYKTEVINHVIVFFGFTYVPDLLTHFPNYYAKQQITGGTYVITEMLGNTKNVLQNISPTVMFTYRFFKDNKQDQEFKFGLTGGFTYNTQTLGALFGPSCIIGDIISVNTGITAVQKYALLGQYTPGQVIKDNLSYSQLHSQVWTYDIYFSIGLNIPQLFNKSSGTPN